MKTISEAGKHFDWIHPDPDRSVYELRSGEEIVASLACESSIDSATAETSGGAFELKRFGYANPHVLVRKKGGEKEEARFDSSETEPGLLKLANGRQFHWEGHLWRAEWAWNATSGDRVVSFKRDFEVGEKHEGSVEVHGESPHLDLLILVGWYLILIAATSSGGE